MAVLSGFPVDQEKVIDKVIDVYLWVSNDLNNGEVALLGQQLINLSKRQASDVEMEYVLRRQQSIQGYVPDSQEGYPMGLESMPGIEITF